MTVGNKSQQASQRIAIVYNSAWYLYQFRSPLIRALQERGYEIHAVSPEDGAEKKLVAMGVVHHPISLTQHGADVFAELKALLSIARVLRRIRPGLVISYTIKCNIYCGLLRRLFGFSQLANIVGLGRAFENPGLLASAARTLYRFAIHGAEKTFFQNQEDRDSFVSQKVVRHEATVVTPGSGVDIELFSPTPAPAENEPVIFFMYGRLIPAKGFDLFARAAAELHQRHGKSVECWVAGGLDGEQSSSRELRDRLLAASEKGELRFLGYRDDIQQLVADCTTVVLPSTYNEGVPRSLLEALASGKSVITTDWKGCRETIEENSNGRLIEPADQQSLTAAMEEIVHCSPEERARMAAASRALAERKFDQRLVVNSYLKVIAETLAS